MNQIKFLAPTLTVLVAGASALVVLAVHAQTNAVAPFRVIERTMYYRYPTGELAKTLDVETAVRGDGSSVETRFITTPDGQPAKLRIVIDIPAKRRVVIDDATQSVSTTRLSAEYAATFTQKLSTCTSDNAAPHSIILGFDTVKVIIDFPTDHGTPVLTEAWAAPALNCFPLRKLTSVTKSGASSIIATQTEALSVTLGDPAGTSFDSTQTGYVERSPSEVIAEFNRRFPGHPPSPGLAQPDAAYRKQH